MRAAELGVGIVGCGAIGTRRAQVALATPGSRIVAVADTDTERAAGVARETGAVAAEWEKVIAHPAVDLVVVATTHDWLARITIAALRAGKHVLCEKPMSLDRREAEDVVAASREAGREVHVGFNHRYHPAIRRAHDLLNAGAIGAPLFARCRYGHGGRPGYEQEWRMDVRRSGGGELLDQGIHAIDLFRWFLGDLREVTGFTAQAVWKGSVEDNAFALFRTAQGQVATLHASWTQWKNLFSFEVFGDAGAALVDGLGKSYGTERVTLQRRQPGGPPLEQTEEFPGPDLSWDAEWRDLLGALREGRPAPIGAADGLAALRLVEAVYEADRSRAVVTVTR